VARQAHGTTSRATFDTDGRALGLVSSDFRTGRSSFAGLGDDPDSLWAPAPLQRLDGFSPSAGTVLAGVALLGGVAALFVRAAPFLAGLYARIRTGALPEHPTRAAIIELVTQNPGIRYSDLLSALGCGKGTLEHHLALLERGGHVVLVKRNGLACYFRTRGAAADDAKAWLRSTTARRIVGLLDERPRSTAKIHELVGCSRSNAHRHLVRMEQAGLIRRNDRQADLTESGRRAWHDVRSVPRPI
jgi:DNA-binding MarR family transcriptional regulator